MSYLNSYILNKPETESMNATMHCQYDLYWANLATESIAAESYLYPFSVFMLSNTSKRKSTISDH